MPSSAELHERRIAAVARGVGHATSIYAKRAKNAEIWSEDGKRYIDFGSGIAVVNTGHQHPKVVAAIEEQHPNGRGIDVAVLAAQAPDGE